MRCCGPPVRSARTSSWWTGSWTPNDQERERGITILAKAASVTWNDTRINLVDTPGHADFGGEVERALTMVDGVLLLVDAAEGPLPQTRYVLSKALAQRLPTVVVVNKVDRSDARADEVLDEIYELFLDLGAEDEDIEFPIVSAVAREGRAVAGIGNPGPDDDLTALFEAILATVPAPVGDPEAPLQALVTNLDASDYLGRLAIGRVVRGTLRKGEPIALLDEEVDEGQTPLTRRLTHLQGFEGVGRIDVEERVAGDLFVIAGYPEVEIGDTLADAAHPEALPRLSVDEPVLRMTFGVNTSPMAGKVGRYVTSRQLKERLDREVLGNVSIRVGATDSPDVMEVAGRGELQLAVLIENMRRESYEVQVSRPEVIVKTINDKKPRAARAGRRRRAGRARRHRHAGARPPQGQVTDLRPGDPGRTVVTFEAPARGLIGFRGMVLTATRGTALLHTHNAGWMPWAGELPHRLGGAMLADRTGSTTAYALDNLQARGELFVGPGEAGLRGHGHRRERPSGRHGRQLRCARSRRPTSAPTATTRASSSRRPKVHTLETAIEWIAEDELVEVTPDAIRIRKRVLAEQDRRRLSRKTG